MSLLNKALILCLFCASATAIALPEDRKLTVLIDADDSDQDLARNVIIYSGNVTITQGQLKIKADYVEVHTKDGEPSLLKAGGSPATFIDAPQRIGETISAKGNNVLYTMENGTIKLTGQVKYRDFYGNEVSAPSINVDVASGRIKSSGGVHHTIVPPKTEE